MRAIFFVSIFCMLCFLSCRKDFEYTASNGTLEFSKNTVYLDTVFTNISTSTYTLKVYNKSNTAIKIPTITLAKGENSKYRLLVDGSSGKDGNDADAIGDGKFFENIEIMANDSLYVFIEATAGIADANATDLLYTDKIIFDAGLQQQTVNLVTLIKDAVFLYPERYPTGNGGFVYEKISLEDNTTNKVKGFYLNDSELNFTNQKPYVIYGYAAVPDGKTLTMQAGTRVYFHDQSGIVATSGSSLQINGLPSINTQKQENEVILSSDRLEPGFKDTPGQWEGIQLLQGSTNNKINHCTIKNVKVGLYVKGHDNSRVQIKNTQIYNAAFNGLLAKNAHIDTENIVINKTGQSALSCTNGGSYNFVHCTFANYWNYSTRQNPTVWLDNTEKDLTKANFTNCIIYGSNTTEFGLNKNTKNAFNYSITFSLIRFSDNSNSIKNNILYDCVTNPVAYNNIISNLQNNNDPKFKNANANNLQITNTSVAIAKGSIANTITTDINNKTRTIPPDLGAYQHIE